jgi:hypothetical protein
MAVASKGEYKGTPVLHFDSYADDGRQFRTTMGFTKLAPIVENIDQVLDFLRTHANGKGQAAIKAFTEKLNKTV